MADPFGTGTGIVGVISLAIQITQAVVQLGMDWKDAPDNVKTFMAELGTLKTVLSETNTNILINPDFEAAFHHRPSLLLSQLGPNASSTTDTNLMLEICRRELDSMLKELKKRGQSHRLGWERLKGAFLAKDTRDSVENLCRQCQTLNNMLSIDATVLGLTMYKEVREVRKEQQEWRKAGAEISSVIRAGVDESNRRQENQARQHERQALLDWLTPIEYASQQSDFINRRQAETGQWLLDSEKFQTWLNTDKQTLFCPGIPGAGKTILTSIVVNYLYTRFQNDPNIGIAYLYCNFRRKDEQKIGKLLASLLKQLVEYQPSLPGSLETLYDSHKDKQTQPSFDEIARVLQSVAAAYSRVFIIVDALDECQISDGCRQRLLSGLFHLQAKCRVNLFATSRPISSVEKKIEGNIIQEIRASEEDVRRYLDGHMFRLPGFVVRSLELQEEIKTSIIQAVDGMFLLAQLHLESLTGKRAPKAVRTALKNLATGSRAYDCAYEDAMERISGQIKDQEELAKQVLWWITCAKRPLTTLELQHALAIEIGESQLDEDNIPQVEDIVSACAGLVTVDEESSIIRLVHYTAQEYFDRTRAKWFPNAETDIATICLTHLLFTEFESGICSNDKEFEERLRLYPLYRYASQNWGYHARAVSTKVLQLTLNLLEDGQKTLACTQGMIASGLFPGYSQQRVPQQMTGLHLAVFFELKEVILALLKNGYHPDAKDSSGQTPLSWAAENGHEEVVRLLLERGAELESKDNNNQTPLLWAIRNGHNAVVRLLLEKGAALESQDNNGPTLLLWAARRGHEAVVGQLLENGAELESKDSSGQTPLSWAARNGREAVVGLLLEKSAELDSEDKNGQTPLLWAARKGHEAIVRLLLEKGAELGSDKCNRTPLSWAAEIGHEAVVKMLLATGKADADSRDEGGRTPLSYAAWKGHVAVVELLLQKGAEVESKSKQGQTPLSYAAWRGHVAVVKLLLEKGAEVESKSKHGQTPLLYAASSGHEGVVRMLRKHIS